MDDEKQQGPPLPAGATMGTDAGVTQNVPLVDTPGGVKPAVQPANVPPPAPQPAQPSAPDQPKPRSGFDPQKADGFIDKWGDDAIDYFRDRLGVTKIEADAARAKAQARYGLTDEQAAAIPGQTAEDIQRAAEFAASLREPNTTGKAKPEQQEPENQPAPTPTPTGAPLPPIEVDRNTGELTDEQIFDPRRIPPEFLG